MSLLGDLRYALRRARARPGFTLIAVLSLGIGIGVNTAAFSLLNAILLRKTPVSRPDRVAEVMAARDQSVFGPLSYPDYKDLREQGRAVFSQFSLSRFTVVLRDMGDHVEGLTTELVNGDYFPLIGLPAQVGRLLGPDDDLAQGAHPVAVLSYQYWRSAFAGDPAVVGKTLRLSGRAYTVVGVAPRSVEGLLPGLAPSLYAPVQMENELDPFTHDALAQRGNNSFFARVRLADGQTFSGARGVVDQFVNDMRRRYPEIWSPHSTLLVFPLSQIAVSPLLDTVVKPAAAALIVVTALVLVVACTNLASFLLAQARDRQREIALRLALGASRGVLVRQLLAESLTLAAVGGGLGVALSTVALRTLLHAKLPLPLPINLDAGLDLRVLLFAIAASVVAGVAFGLLPALQATRPNVIQTIKSENAGSKPGRRYTMRSVLVVGQTATSLLLLVTAALFLRSFAAQSNIDPGFGSVPASMVWMSMPPDRAADQWPAMIAEMERRARDLPGIASVGVTVNIPLNPVSNSSEGINVDGFEPPKGEKSFEIDYTTADSGFFDAAGIRLVSGRLFNASDVFTAQRVAIVNEAMAHKFWPGQDAVSRTFREGKNVYRIIGVSRTTKVRSLGEPPHPFIFGAFAQSPSAGLMLVARVRTGEDAAKTSMRILAMLHDVEPGLLIIEVKTMEQHLAVMLLPARLGAVSFAVFASLALVLAIIGIYGVVRYAVSRRSREVAIRLAVGAAPAGVVGLLMRDGVVLVSLGALIGLGVALVVSRALQSLLYGIAATDPVAFIGAPLVLITVGAFAAFLPARRAAGIDPSRTLRGE